MCNCSYSRTCHVVVYPYRPDASRSQCQLITLGPPLQPFLSSRLYVFLALVLITIPHPVVNIRSNAQPLVMMSPIGIVFNFFADDLKTAKSVDSSDVVALLASYVWGPFVKRPLTYEASCTDKAVWTREPSCLVADRSISGLKRTRIEVLPNIVSMECTPRK